MASLAQINIRFAANLREFSSQMQTMQREFKKTADVMKNIGTAFSVAVSLPLAAAGTAAYNMASDFEDALGATDQIFKDASGAVQEWAQGLPTYYGIAKKEALEYSNMMGSMLKNIGGLTEEAASKQSAKLIELAGDLTAMYGGTTADAVRALTGALKGNNTMLDNYGMAANDALVKAKAFEMGLITQGSEMTLAAKQAATLALVFEQSGAAQGQAAREADASSGSMRALKTELTNLATELGEHLLPIITPFVQKIRDLISRFREASPETKKLLVVVGGLAAALGPVLVALGGIVSAVPLVVSGIASIGTAFTVMTGPIGLVVAAIGGLIYLMVKNWGAVKKILIDSANYFIDLYNESLVVRAGIESVVAVLKILGNTVKLVFNVAGTILKGFGNSLKNLVSTIGSLFKAMITGDFKAIPSILSEGFSKGFEDSKKALDDFKNDFSQFGDDVKDTLQSSLKNAFRNRYKLLGEDVDSEEVKEKIKKDVAASINEGVNNFNKSGKKAEVKVKIITEGSENWYNEQISQMEEELGNLDMMSDAYRNLSDQIQIYKNTLDMIKNPPKIELEPEQGTVDWYDYHINKLKEAQSQAGITVQEFARLEQEINMLETTFKMEVEIDGYEEFIEETNHLKTISEELQTALNGVFSDMSEGMVESLGEAKNGLDRFAKSMFTTVMKLIGMALSSSLANAIQGATQTGTSTGPAAVFTTPAFIATAVGGIMAAFASIPKFADGGVVYGPTLGLMGEYAGAANNPEVIAPLNKLKDLINPVETGDVIVQLSGGFDVSGETLKLVLDRTERRKFRTG